MSIHVVASLVTEVSPRMALIFGLRWVLDRIGNDPCDEWDADVLLDLPEGLFWEAGTIMFECRSCERKTPWEGEVADFELGARENVCGGSPWCLP